MGEYLLGTKKLKCGFIQYNVKFSYLNSRLEKKMMVIHKCRVKPTRPLKNVTEYVF